MHAGNCTKVKFIALVRKQWNVFFFKVPHFSLPLAVVSLVINAQGRKENSPHRHTVQFMLNYTPTVSIVRKTVEIETF